MVWNCKWDNFIQEKHSYGPWFASKMHFCSNVLRMNRRISRKFCICIDIYIHAYMIYINPITFCFSLFFNRVTALDLWTKCVSPKYLPNKWLHFEKSLLVLLSKFKMHTKSQHSGGVSWKLKLLWLLGQDVGANCISSWSLLIFLLWPYLGASKCWGHSVLQTLALVFV